jgi:hypothetical protein
MMTSQLDLLDLYTDTILKASDTSCFGEDDEDFRKVGKTYFSPPGQELLLPSSTLTDLLGDSPTLMSALAELYVSEEGSVFGKAVLDIESFLADPAVDLNMKEYRARRLLDYVYPVV